MSIRAAAIALVAIFFIAACGKATAPQTSAAPEPPSPAAGAALPGGTPSTGVGGVSLSRLERKIVRTGNLDVEADDPRELVASARGMIEELGGYVASSDVSRDHEGSDPADVAVRMVLRVPSQHFSRALDGLKRAAANVASERVGAEDVTDEFIDLEAHIRSEKALEAQFVEILKGARSVKDALEVHTQLAQVRADIEKLEGRRQLLESQSALSTIHFGVTRRSPVVRTSFLGFGQTFSRAASDAAATTAAIVHGAIRLLAVALPLLALVVMPLFFVARSLLRRVSRGRSPA